MMNKIFESTVEYNADFDEYFLPLPDELLELLGWEADDMIEWRVNKDGTVTLERIDPEFYGEPENDED
jgi:bifunctional DNA-binding transcriptional regulator/antitoxin component of YhaV-PrlF toxin-antitoxin module